MAADVLEIESRLGWGLNAVALEVTSEVLFKGDDDDDGERAAEI